MKKITFLIVLLTLFSSWYGTAQITTYPYSEDFEEGDGGWVATNGTNGTWALGAPTATIINSAASGANAWTTNLSGNYNASENSFVQSPVFDLSTLSAPSIQFSIWWNTEFSWDGMVLQSSIDSGTSWQNVGAFGDPNNWYTDAAINGLPGGQQVGWSGRTSTNDGSNGWVVARHALTGLAGQSNVIFRFAFGSDTSAQDNGVAFDLVSVFEVICPEPINLTGTVTGTTADLTWTNGGSETAWEFINQLADETAPTNADSGTSIGTNVVELMNLTEGADYEFYVRANCVADGFSTWVGPFTYSISGPGETCSNPIVVTNPLPYSTDDNTNNYGDDYSGGPGANCGSASGYLGGDDVVYSYAPTSDTTITITMTPGGTWSGIFVYDDCAAIGVNCLDGVANAGSTVREIELAVNAGTTYYIVISTWPAPQSIPYNLTITENTCTDSVATYTVRQDCVNGPQFYVDVDLTDLGSATSVTISDNQGSAPQSTSATGLFTFGPFPNATDVVITVANDDDANCTLTSTNLTQEQCVLNQVDCELGPLNFNYCYGNNDDTTWLFQSIDGSPLRLTFNAGYIESCCDDILIYDGADNSGTLLYSGNNGGNLSGLQFDSTGDSLFMEIDSDSSVSCQSGSGIEWDFTVSCATCVNPSATYEVRSDCFTSPQFFVDVDLTDLGSATSITLSDNQGSTPQSTSSTGLFTFGPFPNATDVIITVTNDDDVNCTLTSSSLTQEFCLDSQVDCAVGPLNISYCYTNNDTNVFSYTSTDGTPLNLTINSGEVEWNTFGNAPYDPLIILDSDGVTELYNGGGNQGDISGLTFQSTGDTIYFSVASDFIISCDSGAFPEGINYTVACATCINPSATYEVRSDCFTSPQFFVDVDLTDLGSATSITLSDNQGSTPQSTSATGMFTFGPFPNATDVIITVANDDDVNCTITSSTLTQAFCLDSQVDCAVGPLNVSYCYTNSDSNVFSYISTDGSPLNLTINSGEVEGSPYDFLVILDSDGVTELYNGEGNNGDISGLTFQSTGDTIYFSIQSDSSVSCASGSYADGINYTVACATCINPAATYSVIDDCDNGAQFLIDVNITSLGDATSLTVTDNQGSPSVPVTATGVVQMGPYPFATPIIITISNDQDVNCVINSSPIQVAACPPANDNCLGATVAVVNPGESCDAVTSGTILAATPSGVPAGSCGGNPNDDVWFQFTAVGTQQIIQLLNLSGGTTNLDHAVYEGVCDSLVELYCETANSSVTPSLTIGNTYYVRVFSAGSAEETTSFDLCIQTLGNPTYCLDALPICAGFTYPSATGDNVAPPYLDYGCLGSQPDPTWYTLLFDEAGDYQFTIDQDTTDPNNNDDVDFIIWGPYNDQQGGCVNLLPENIMDCSFSPSDIETVTLSNVQAGDIYVLLITNYGQAEGTYTFSQDFGPADGTNCSVVCDVTVDYQDTEILEDAANPDFAEPIELCGFESITLTANSAYANDFEWYNDNISMEIYTESLTVTESGIYSVVAYGGVCDGFDQSIQIPVILGTVPTANSVSDIVTCDDVTGDGFEEFDLESQTATVLGDQDATQFNVTYHLSQEDAVANTGALTSPYTNISNPQTIYVRVEDANATFCIATTSFNLVISGPTPTATSRDIELCEDDNDGTEQFDLTAHNVNVLNGQSASEYTVTYYASEGDASAGTSPLASPYTNTTNPQTIWARVDNNTAVDCYAVIDFDLIVSEIPVTTFATDFEYEICPNVTVPLVITAIPQNYTASEVTIVWYQDGGVIQGETGLTLPVLMGGLYEIEVTFNGTNCPAEPVGITVVQLENCIIPQGISPNNDGLNDTFDLSNFDVQRIEIFNRLGTLVYSKDNYTNEWFGQTDNGDELPVGTYFYTMIYEGGAKTKSSWVYINK